MSASLALVSVPFQGGAIDAVRDDRGVWISIRRVCESLGIDYSTQLQKLKEKPWARVGLIPMQLPGDVQRRDIATVDLDSLPMWLATIEPSRVAPEVAPKLIAYQREAARVLREHFFPRPADAAPVPFPRLPPRLWRAAEPLELALDMLAREPGVTTPAVLAALIRTARMRMAEVPAMGRPQLPPKPRTPPPFRVDVDKVKAHLDTNPAVLTVTSADIITAVGLPPGRATENALGKAMRWLGWWKDGHATTQHGTRSRRYHRP